MSGKQRMQRPEGSRPIYVSRGPSWRVVGTGLGGMTLSMLPLAWWVGAMSGHGMAEVPGWITGCVFIVGQSMLLATAIEGAHAMDVRKRNQKAKEGRT